MSQRNLSDLIIRVRKAQKNLGPHNTYRTLLDECVEAIYGVVRQYADLQEQHAAIASAAAGVVGDRGGRGSAPAAVGEPAGTPSHRAGAEDRDPADDDPLGYGHAV